MAIYLVRHGETAANAGRTLQQPDNPLNAKGIQQAERIAQRLSDRGASLVLASDYARAAHTAEVIARACAVSVEFDEDLRERNFGDLRGRPYSEVGPQVFAPDFDPPNGETWQQFLERAARAWNRIHQRALSLEGSLVVVSHGLFCRALLMSHWTVEPPILPPARGFGNCALTEIDPNPPFRVRLMNCSAHLSGVEEGDGISGI